MIPLFIGIIILRAYIIYCHKQQQNEEGKEKRTTAKIDSGAGSNKTRSRPQTYNALQELEDFEPNYN